MTRAFDTNQTRLARAQAFSSSACDSVRQPSRAQIGGGDIDDRVYRWASPADRESVRGRGVGVNAKACDLSGLGGAGRVAAITDTAGGSPAPPPSRTASRSARTPRGPWRQGPGSDARRRLWVAMGLADVSRWAMQMASSRRGRLPHNLPRAVSIERRPFSSGGDFGRMKLMRRAPVKRSPPVSD